MKDLVGNSFATLFVARNEKLKLFYVMMRERYPGEEKKALIKAWAALKERLTAHITPSSTPHRKIVGKRLYDLGVRSDPMLPGGSSYFDSGRWRDEWTLKIHEKPWGSTGPGAIRGEFNRLIKAAEDEGYCSIASRLKN